ncbi:MAG: hypothetical protein ACKVTZ_13900 [Bacteroidia bacterium]
MKHLSLLIGVLFFSHFAFSQEVCNEKTGCYIDKSFAQCKVHLSFLKSQEKDSIWCITHTGYETEYKKVTIFGATLVGKHHVCGEIYAYHYKIENNSDDSLPTILIQDKSPEITQAKYAIHTKSILCKAIKRWEQGKLDPGCLSAGPCDCRVMYLVDVPAMTIQTRREILLKRNENGKYVEQ